MARQTKTERFSVIDGRIEEEHTEIDEYQEEIHAEMDARHGKTANELTLEFNQIETDRAALAATEHLLVVKKTALQRLLLKHLATSGMSSFKLNGYSYGKTFKPVASVTDKAALVGHCLEHDMKDLLSVHSSTLNAWVGEAVLSAIEDIHADALAALGVDAADDRGKEEIGNDDAQAKFEARLQKILPAGVKATSRTKLSRNKS